MVLIGDPPVTSPIFTVEPLDSSHDRAAFVCKEPALTDYLVGGRALREAHGDDASVYCCVDASKRVVGYYTLSVGGIARDSIARALYGPQWRDVKRDTYKVYGRFPYESIGVIKLGRVAIDNSMSGQRFGEDLIGHALDTALDLAKKAGAKAVILDAKNEAVVKIYKRLGFESFPDHPLEMFIMMQTLRNAKERANQP